MFFFVTEESFCNLQPQKEDRLWKVYTFFRLGRMVIAFLPVFVSRISVIDRVPPEFQASLKETQKNQTNMDETRHLPKFEIYTDWLIAVDEHKNIIRELSLVKFGVQQNHWSSSFGMFWISGPPIPHLFGMRRPPNSRWRPGVEGTAQTYHPAWCERYQGKGGKKRFEASFASHSVSWCSTTKLFYRHSTVSFGSKFQYIWSRIKSWLFRKG